MNNNKIHVINLKDDDAIPELAKLLSRIFGETAKKKSEREALVNELTDADYDHTRRLCAIADKYGLERREVLHRSVSDIGEFLSEVDVDTLDLETGDFKTWKERVAEHEREAVR